MSGFMGLWMCRVRFDTKSIKTITDLVCLAGIQVLGMQ